MSPGTSMNGRNAAPDRPGLTLFLASFLALFVELALIRFIPAHVRAVGYYTNLVLIASFLGLGIGFLLANRSWRLEGFLLPILLACVSTVELFSRAVALNVENTDEPLWLFSYSAEGGFEIPLTALVLIHFALVAAVLVPVGQVMGRYFARLERLQAYALDLGGSLAGVVLFGVFSALGTPPWLWFSVASVLALVVLLRGPLEWISGGLCGAALVALVIYMAPAGAMWSPYYMVEVVDEGTAHQTLLTNGTLHQIMLDFEGDSTYIRKTRERFAIPYQAASSLDDVLIVGSGTGNDIAMALGMGAQRIDAVEIDPLFPKLGKKLHKQKPYDSDKVHLTIGDARSFFRRADRKYDLVVFGTLDSQALLSGLSSVRLDNYVYTENSFKDAYKLLKPDGILAVFHMSIKPFIADRIYLLLAEAGKRPPVYLDFKDHTLFNKLLMQGPELPIPRLDPAYIDHLKSEIIPSDDWPYLYLKEPGLPAHYLYVLLGILAIAGLATFGVLGRRGFARFDLPLFLLGAGFLLLETKAVTQMSLLFGSTWVVNLLVFSAILAVLLAANVFVLKLKSAGRELNLPLLFGLLAGLLVLATAIPVSWLATLPSVLQWLAGALYVALPIGVAGLIFPALFARAADAQAAFGSNLLGAIVGGVLEYFTMILGINSLTLTAAALYLLAWLVFSRSSQRVRA
jgi:SAM-dependent methyltransferase